MQGQKLPIFGWIYDNSGNIFGRKRDNDERRKTSNVTYEGFFYITSTFGELSRQTAENQ